MVWFIRGRWEGGPAFLAEFKQLERWEKNVRDIGHGTSTALSAEDALAIGLKSESTTVTGVAENDPQGLVVGSKVSIATDMESGEEAVIGIVRSANADTLSIEVSNDEVGTVCVHFPRTGYRIEVLP